MEAKTRTAPKLKTELLPVCNDRRSSFYVPQAPGKASYVPFPFFSPPSLLPRQMRPPGVRSRDLDLSCWIAFRLQFVGKRAWEEGDRESSTAASV